MSTQPETSSEKAWTRPSQTAPQGRDEARSPADSSAGECHEQVYEIVATSRYGVIDIRDRAAIRLDFGGRCTVLVDEKVWYRCVKVGSWRPLGQILSREEKQRVGWEKRGRVEDLALE